MVIVVCHCEVTSREVIHGVMKGSRCCCPRSSDGLGVMGQFHYA